MLQQEGVVRTSPTNRTLVAGYNSDGGNHKLFKIVHDAVDKVFDR